MRRPADRLLIRTLLVAVSIAALALAIRADASEPLIAVPSATRFGEHTWTAETGHAGETCTVYVAETNDPQPSAHPGNRLEVATGGATILVLPIEQSRGGQSDLSAVAVLGETLTLILYTEDRSSDGFTVSIDCQEAPPSTTTTYSPPPSTTFAPPSTSKPPTPTTTTSSAPPVSSSTMPPVEIAPPSTSPPTTTAPRSTTTVPAIPSAVPTGVATYEADPLASGVVLSVALIGVAALAGLAIRARRRE